MTFHIGEIPSHTVGLIYRPQRQSTVIAFANELSDIIQTIKRIPNRGNIMICGDINSPGPTSTTISPHVQSVFNIHNLHQLVTKKTHDVNLLDVVATESTDVVKDVNVAIYRMSDHKLVHGRMIYRTRL